MRSFLRFAFCFVLSSSSIAQDNEALDSIIVQSNTQIYLEHVPSDTSAGTFKLIEDLSDSAKLKNVIRIKFGTKPAMGSVLEIFNPYEVPFVYKAFMYNFKKKKYLEASVYPVQPKMGVREMWPFPIESILIKQFELEVEVEK
jgi:hypothetical protein